MNELTKSKNTQLEIIRALACLMVLFGHIYGKTEGLPQFSHLKYLLNWGTESVIIFFVLSGFVIQISQERRQKKFSEFILNRFIRIYPLYFIAILLAFLVAQLTGATASLSQILGHVLFLQTLQGFIVNVVATNQSLWSLSYEIFFYLAFSLSLFSRKFLHVWIALSSICWIFYTFSLSSSILNHFKTLLAFSIIWLLGYGVATYRNSFKFEKSLALSLIPLALTFSRINFIDNFYDIYRLTGFAILCLPLFNICTSTSNNIVKVKNYIVYGISALVLTLLWILSGSHLSTKILLSIISILGIALPKNLQIYRNVLSMFHAERFLIYIASISYAIYIIHMPILYGLEYLIVDKPYLRAMLTFIITFTFSHIFELIIQPKINTSFKKKVSDSKPRYSKI